MDSAVFQCTPWWRQVGALERLVGDLIAGELAHLRPGGTVDPPPWPADLLLDEQGLGLDSLERLSVASALNEALHLHDSGVEDLLLVRRRFGEWVHLAGMGLDHAGQRMTFRTSGSHGAPKPCTHALALLEQEVDFLATLLDGRRRVFSAVPAHHIYGFLFTVLLPGRWHRMARQSHRSLSPDVALVASWRGRQRACAHRARSGRTAAAIARPPRLGGRWIVPGDRTA